MDEPFTEFPENTYAYRAFTRIKPGEIFDGKMGYQAGDLRPLYSNPLYGRSEIDERVEVTKRTDRANKILVATYRLESVEEIEVPDAT